jgi:hypothetical protein
MKGFEKALEGYRIAKGGSYGNVGNGLRGHCYNYTFRRADGTCNALDTDILYQLKFGNSGGGDFLPNFATWNDPLKPIINVCPVDDNHTPSRTVDNRGAYDCKYITLIGEGATPQKYSLSCRVENVSSVSSNDGGINNNLFEIQKPSPWLCIWDVAFNNPAVTGMYGCLDVPTYTCHAAGT